MTKLESYHSRFEDRERKYRKLRRLLDSEIFRDAWDYATVVQKQRAYELLEAEDPDNLRKWARSIVNKDLEAKSYAELRELAKGCALHDYSRKKKDQLIRELRETKYGQTDNMA